MVEKQYEITSSAGLHARPASALVSAVTSFIAEVTLEHAGKKVNLKSILGVMSLGITSGAVITISAEGEDEVEALAKVDEIMKNEGLAN